MMSNAKITRLIIGLMFVGFLSAGRHALSADPAPGETDIRGNWRPSIFQCSDGRFMIVGDKQISFVGGADHKPIPLKFDIEIVKAPQLDGPILVFHPWTQPPGILMLVHTDLSDGTFRFVAAEWSDSAKAAFGTQLNEVFPMDVFLGDLQIGQPYHRCS